MVGVLLELLHVRSDQHLSQLDEVAVLLVINLDDTPWIASSTDFTSIGAGNLGVGTNNGERDLRHDLIVLGNVLIIIELISWAFEDLDIVVLNISENLRPLSMLHRMQ